MKRITAAALLLLGPLLLAAAPAGAQPSPAGAGDEDSTMLHLDETATRTVRQDRLTVELRADVSGPDAARVQATVNRRMAAALDKAKTAPSVHAATLGYWVEEERPKNAPAHWRGVESLQLTGTDSAAVLSLAGALQQGGLVMSRLAYDVAPETERAVQNELTTAALQRLKDRVDRIAKDMGLYVRNFRNLRVGNVTGPVPPRPLMMRAMAAASPAAPPPVAEPGEATLQVAVDADVVLARNPP